MKSNIKKVPWNSMLIIPLAMLVFLLKGNSARSQAIDCTTGTTMYGIFVDTLGSSHADSTEIRPINYLTGVIGPLLGGRRYYIRKQYQTSPSRYYYGASAMGVSGVTNRAYVMTQMANPIGKDIIAIDPTAATHAAAVTVIGTTPSSLNNYHFVKLAMSPTGGYGYAIGVLRDSSLSGYNASNYNPLIRFDACNTLNCTNSAIILLGYLPGTGNMYKTQLFNGDIAFDAGGNLYFATAAFQQTGGIARYTDSRLFRINSADIPSSAGSGTIPMTFVADFNTLDSTVLNGIAFSGTGSMYFATRRFTGVQTAPAGHSTSELYGASNLGMTTLIPGFNTTLTMPDKSIADLGSCYFPSTVLASNKLQLSAKYDGGKNNLRWQVNNNNIVNYYEIQISDDGTNFTTLTTLNPENITQANAVYLYTDSKHNEGTSQYYRVRQAMKDGFRFYSNVVKINSNRKIDLLGSLSPNPFIDHINFAVQLKSPGTVSVRLADQSGRIVYNNQFNGKTGENKIKVNDISNLKKGIYFVEISAENEIIREKVVKQ